MVNEFKEWLKLNNDVGFSQAHKVASEIYGISDEEFVEDFFCNPCLGDRSHN